MRVEVRKSIEFSLPQAQVFYISSRNKFILLKQQIFRFLLLCPAVLQFLVPQLFRYSDLFLIRPDKENNYAGLMATRHVEDGSKPC